MTELGDIFAELGVSQYLSDFVEQGFDTWDTVLDITESDLDSLNVKLGHRRKLQRRIANSRGFSSDRALESPGRNTPADDRVIEEQKPTVARVDVKDVGAGPQGAKRKYRRHPKTDDNAPERPPSAYVIFSNKMREDLKGQHLSFTEIAKLVGEHWQALSPSEKEPFEQQAFTAKDRYNCELAEYKKTPLYKDYSQYLTEFKARQSNQHQVADLDAKRPKLEPHRSTASSGTASSGASLHEGENPSGRMRVESAASVTGQWPVHDGQPSPQISTPASSISKVPVSPILTSPAILPGYRESIFTSNQQALPWRDGQRDDLSRPHLQQLPRISSIADRQLNQTGPSGPDSLNHIIPKHKHRTSPPASIHPPPLLKSESTNRSTTSSSTISSTYYSPRTPLEPPLDRPLSIPSLYPQKSLGTYESQLPPLGPPSLSPQTSTHTQSQQSPTGLLPQVDFSTAMAPMRGYTSTGSRQILANNDQDERFRSYSSPDDNILDPVSALIRAGEIVDRSSRGRQQ